MKQFGLKTRSRHTYTRQNITMIDRKINVQITTTRDVYIENILGMIFKTNTIVKRQ